MTKGCAVSNVLVCAASVIVAYAASVAMAGPALRYERMSAAELQEAIKARPVAFLPAGIVEWHGEQSACGLDGLKAETLCLLASEAMGGVAFPQIWLGPDASTPFNPAQYPQGTLTIDKSLYHAAAEQLLTGIEAMGFKCAVYLSGHYPGVIHEVAEKFNQRGGIKVISISENMVVKGMPAGDHAAAWETSMLMVLRPGLVNLLKLPPLPSTTQPAGDVIPPPSHFHQLPDAYGIYGADPRVFANEYYGRQGTQAVIKGIAEAVTKVLDGQEVGDTQKQRQDAGATEDAGAFEWPTDDRQRPEVRYCHLLPGQWMSRFMQMPIVFVPVVPADETIGSTVSRAIEWARSRGGMAFPPIGYAPCEQRGRVSMNPETYMRVVSEVASDLAAMDFRVVVLVGSPKLSASARQDLDKLCDILMAQNKGQSRFLMADASGFVPAGLDEAMVATIPPSSASVRVLEGPWKRGDRVLYGLSGTIYGGNEPQLYEHTFECTAAEAASMALLDLGSVENRCEVRLNDSSAIVDHWPPYRLLVTGMLKPGTNRLTVGIKHERQPTLDPFFDCAAPPRLQGPVRLIVWK